MTKKPKTTASKTTARPAAKKTGAAHKTSATHSSSAHKSSTAQSGAAKANTAHSSKPATGKTTTQNSASFAPRASFSTASSALENKAQEFASTARAATTAATENLRGLTEQAFSSDHMRDFVSNTQNEAKRAQDKIHAFTKQSAAKVSESANNAGRNLQEAMATGRDMLQACVESGNVATDMTKTLSTQFFQYANERFTQNIEMSKDYFTCRTLNDMAELQSRILRANLDQFFFGAAELSNLLFEYADQAAEPFSDRVASAGERLNKKWAA